MILLSIVGVVAVAGLVYLVVRSRNKNTTTGTGGTGRPNQDEHPR